MVDDALALGVKHAALNVNLSQVVAAYPGKDPRQLTWNYSGKQYFFDRDYVNRLDRNIKSLSDHHVVVYVIILAYQSSEDGVNRRMLHPNYDPSSPNRLGAFNTQTEEGRCWFAATLEFLAERWSRPKQEYGRVAGYIIGNEVNSHWWWCNMGRATLQEFTDQYIQAMRIAHGAIRRQASWPRLYVSLEHHWNIRYPAGEPDQAFAGRAFLDYFARRARESPPGDFDWHVALHPYPENLFEPRFWNDKSAQPNIHSPRITFKNLEVLAAYLRRPELLYAGAPRRIILSEQGFHTPDSPDGETIQAAAYCYAYKKVEALDAIDAFILHRHVDHPHEGGLLLGLRRYQPGKQDARPKKKIYKCFEVADAADWQETFDFALPIVGLDNWYSADFQALPSDP